MKGKVLTILVAAAVGMSIFAGCSAANEETTASQNTTQEETKDDAKDSTKDAVKEKPEVTEEAKTAESAEEPIHIDLVAKGFQHQFWQTVKLGAEAAAAKYGVITTFDGPPTESDIADQVNMLNAALAKNPNAICLAALDTESVASQIEQAKADGIPVIGFDSGVPNAPKGSIAATAATDNKEAAKIAAEKFMENEDFLAKLNAATEENPMVIALLAQDVTSSSITLRSEGFIEKMKELAETVHPDAVAVKGHSLYEAESKNPAKVIIMVTVPPTSDTPAVKSAAQALLAEEGLAAVFCSNEGTVTGFLAATNDGVDLADGGKYEDLIVAGFDAGKTQKNAVREGWFIGSVSQDPYQIGYQAVELAVKAVNGETVSDVDTGAVWYDAKNIDAPDVAQLVYD